jgi:hypothetical protein
VGKEKTTMKFYKVLNEDGSCFYGGTGKWPLPVGKEPGAWMPKLDKLEMCVSGYHIIKREQLVRWLGPAIFEVEVRGDTQWEEDKGIAQEARLVRKLDNWNEKNIRLFACDCADSVRHLMKDKRSTDAIDVARRFAKGEASKEERDAAWAAAGDAACAAARDAACAAARDAAWAAARAAACAAAGDAARDAARDAAWAAAGDAAGAAQTKCLFEYLEGK